MPHRYSIFVLLLYFVVCLTIIQQLYPTNAAAPRPLAFFRRFPKIKWRRHITDDDPSNRSLTHADSSTAHKIDVTATTTLGSVLVSSLKEPKFWSRSLLWGIVFYGVVEFGKMLATSMEEMERQFQQTIATPDAASRPVFGSLLVAKVIHYLQQANDETDIDALSSEDPLFRRALSWAVRLRKAGIPWLSSSSTRSVESLLGQFNAAELRLLDQALYVPSVAPRPIGLQHVQESLMQAIQQRIRPPSSSSSTKTNPFAHLFTTESASPHLGALLYGPPGCGKTLLIKTLAADLQLPCVMVTPSLLLDKYFGETTAHVRRLFALLQNQLAPCILCIDELDGLFHERRDEQHEVKRELITEFLQWIDGMMTTSSSSAPIILLGATNRPFDVDAALVRRLPWRWFIGAPDAAARAAWWDAALSKLPHTLSPAQCDALVAATDQCTPADLHATLQAAVLAGPLRRGGTVRPQRLEFEDFEAVRVERSGGGSLRYQAQMAQFRNSQHPAPLSSVAERRDPDPPSVVVWKTLLGNYYHLGSVEVDHTTMDLLDTIAQELENYKPDDDEEEKDQ